MDRSDPEAMAAERHQDRLDDDADARDAARWRWSVTAADGTKLQDGEEGSAYDAYEALADAGPQEDDVEPWEDRADYERFWSALQDHVPTGGFLRVTDPMGVVYEITDTL